MANASSPRHWKLDATALQNIADHVRGLAEKQGLSADVVPTAAELHTLIEESFWATVIPDEGRYPTFTLLFCPPEVCDSTFPFDPLPVSAEAIARLAPVLKSQTTRLGVTRSAQGRLEIWGVIADPTTRLEVRGIAPGRVVVQLGWENLGIVTAQETKLLLGPEPAIEERHGLGRPQASAFVSAQFGATQKDRGRGTLMGILLLMVAESMRSQGNGGTLIVVPSVDSPVLKAIDLGKYQHLGPEGDLLAELLDYFTLKLRGREPMGVIPRDTEFQSLDLYLRGRFTWANVGVRSTVDAVGQLSAIDGAVVLTEHLKVLAFGAKITQGPREREEIDCREITNFDRSTVVPLASLGGTRKQSAARLLINNYPDPVVLVASHDGPLYAGAWALGQPNGPAALWVSGLETLLD